MPEVKKTFLDFEDVNERYTEKGLREMLDLSKGKCADGYGHTKQCIYFLQECKSNQIKDALIQLEDTANRIFEKRKHLDKLFIIANKLSKYEQREYVIAHGKLCNKKTKRPIVIRGMEVNFIFRKDLTKWRW